MLPPNRLMDYVKHAYVRHEAYSDDEKQLLIEAGIKPDARPKGALKIVLELYPNGVELVESSLKRREDMTPLQELLKDWLQPVTRKYAHADMMASNLERPYIGMLTKINGRECLEISVTLAPCAETPHSRLHPVPERQQRALADAAMDKLLIKLRGRRLLPEDESRFTQGYDHLKDRVNFEFDCIKHFLPSDVSAKIAENEIAPMRLRLR